MSVAGVRVVEFGTKHMLRRTRCQRVIGLRQRSSLSSGSVHRHGRRRFPTAKTTAAGVQLVHVNLVGVVVDFVVIVSVYGPRRRVPVYIAINLA